MDSRLDPPIDLVVSDMMVKHLVEAESHHRGDGGRPKKRKVAQVGVEHVVHLANILGVALAGFWQAESVFEVADDTNSLLEDHDEHGDENQIELLL